MPTKIRLQRRGKKGQAFYHIVIADGRAPRDGRFIERIGIYNPLINPAEIVLDSDKALEWLKKGAQPTETVRAILSFKGVLYKNHLLKGVAKGAFSLDEAEQRFQAWKSKKDTKLIEKKKELELNLKQSNKKILEEERKVSEAKAQSIAKKQAETNARLAAETYAQEQEITPAEQPLPSEETKQQ